MSEQLPKERLSILLALLLLAGCDRVVSSADGASRIVGKDIHCRHMGYCYTCMPGFDGKMKCNFKLSPHCPGSQQARVRITDVTSILKSGKTRVWERQEVVERIGRCR